MVAGGSDYAGKLRPAVIVQTDEFDATLSISVCLFTTNTAGSATCRVRVSPSGENGLAQPSFLMVDKVTPILRSKLGRRIGNLSEGDIARLNRAMIVFFGLAGPR